LVVPFSNISVEYQILEGLTSLSNEKRFGHCSSPDDSSPDCSSHYRIKCLVETT